MAKKIVISIVVPTYNSSRNLELFLASCQQSVYKNFEVIINDDKRTDDDTHLVVDKYSKHLLITYLQKNKSMAQARRQGALVARGAILLHLDSDMRISQNLLGECAELMESSDGLVIPEESIGDTYWAKCKWLEKRFYENVEEIESLRCVKSYIYKQIGGHDEKMIFSEDKDLDIRVRAVTSKIGRSINVLFHDEGKLSLFRTLRKKEGYGKTANLFAEKHPAHYRWQINILNRYVLYFSRPRLIIKHPLLFVGMMVMKTLEFGAGAIGLLTSKRGSFEAASNHRNAHL